MQSEIYEQSIEAIRNGEEGKLTKLLDGECLEEFQLNNILHLAIKLHQTPIVKMLVKAPKEKPQTYHVDPRTLVTYIVEEVGGIKKEYKYNAFTAAAFYGHIDILELLVESVAVGIQKTNEALNHYTYGRLAEESLAISTNIDAEIGIIANGTPIHIAAQKNYLEIVKYLIPNPKIKIEFQNHDTGQSFSILEFAATERSGIIMQQLIEKRHDLILKHKELLEIAIESRTIETAKILLQFIKTHKNINVQIWFVQNESDDKAQDHYKKSLMYKAINLGLTEIVEEMAQMQRAGISQRYIYLATKEANYKMVHALANYGGTNCDGRGFGGDGKAPIRISVENLEGFERNSPEYYERLEILCIFLRGPDTDYDDIGRNDPSDRYCPLYIAIQKNLIDAVKLLAARGVNLKVKCSNGKTPLELAMETNNREILDILEYHSQENRHGYAFYKALESEYLAEVERLSKGGAAITTSTSPAIMPATSPEHRLPSQEELSLKNTKDGLELLVKEYVNSNATSSNALDLIRLEVANLIKKQLELEASIANMSQEQKDYNLRLLLLEQESVKKDQIEAKISEINNDPYKKTFLYVMQQEFSSNFIAAQAIYSGVIHCDMVGNFGRAGQIVQIAGSVFQPGIGSIIQGLGAIMSHLDYNQQAYNVMNFCRITSDMSQMHRIATLLAINLLEQDLNIEEHEENFLQKLEAFVTKISNIRTEQVLGLFKKVEASTETKKPEEVAGERAAKIASKLIITKIFEGKFDRGNITDIVTQFSNWVSEDFSCLDNQPLIVSIKNDALDRGQYPISLEQKSYFSKVIKCLKNILHPCCKTSEGEERLLLESQEQEIVLPSYDTIAPSAVDNQNHEIDTVGNIKSFYSAEG
jgi:ankyrin repeat protein